MTGPFGGDVDAMAVDPRKASHLLLGTQDAQLFSSTDSGNSWHRVKPGIKALDYTFTVILFDRERPGVIFVGAKQINDARDDSSGGGVFRSDDDGQTWRELEQMRGRSVRGMVQAVSHADTLVVAARDGIYRSKNRGESWRRITPEGDPELRGIHSVAVDPRDADTIYVGTWHLPWKTTDGGEHWKRAASREQGMIDDSDIFSIHIDESNPDTILMSACSGIYRSLNSSEKWTKIQGIPNTSRRTHVIYQHPTHPELIFAGTTEGLWRSTNAGRPDSWARVTSLRQVINAIAIHPDKPDRVYLGTEDFGVFVSNDGGETYEPSNAGFVSRQVRAVLADRTERGRVYAGVVFDATNGGLFVSSDGGMTWQHTMKGIGVRDVYSLYQPEKHPETIYAGTNHGLFRSNDHGRTWAPVKRAEDEDKPAEEVTPSSTPVRTLPQTFFVAPQKSKSAASRSKTSKQTSKQRQTVAHKPPPPKPKPKPEPPEFIDLDSQVFALIPLIPRNADEPPSLLAASWDGLFRCDDEARGWKQMKLPANVARGAGRVALNTVATSAHAPGLLMIGTEDGLFESRDNGVTFDQIRLDDESHRVKVVAFDPRTADTIYVGTANAFFRSTDGGRTWEHRGGGLPQLCAVSALAINPQNPDELYVGDYIRGGFYHSRNRGRDWESLDISGLPSQRLLSLAADPFDPQRLYAGSFSSGVYVMSRR